MWRLLLLLAVVNADDSQASRPISATCLRRCPDIYQPVCALCPDGETTFVNGCQLSRENLCVAKNQCIKLHDGQCGDPPPGSETCDMVCPDIYDPVCALCDDGETTFGNECELQRQNSCNPSNQCSKLQDGECGPPSCPIACTLEYKPVCARCEDGSEKTFGNGCALGAHNTCNPDQQCTQVSDGECKEVNPGGPFCTEVCDSENHCTVVHDGKCTVLNSGGPICPEACTDEYQPVCAQCPNGKQTFSNACSLQLNYCQTGEECTALHDGVCENCARPCPFYDIDVCAVCNDGTFHTFPNTCLMENYNCENNDNCRNISQGVDKKCPPRLQLGPGPVILPRPPRSACDHIFCPAIHQPVCAQCGRTTRTFENGCALEVYNCRNNNKCIKISDGDCPTECSNRRDPVCATCSNQPRTFQNKCIFDSYNFFNPQDNCKINHNGPCRTICPLYKCPDIQSPICALCGTEERTFDNECMFNSYNCPAGYECSKLHDGACKEVNPGGPICPGKCTKEYRPVCAQCPNGQQTFSNLCLLQQNNCQSRGGCDYLRDGECSSSCPRFCPLIDVQVCALCANNVYREFPNTCMMTTFNCNTGDNCQFVSQGGGCPPGPNPPIGFPTDPSVCAATTCSNVRKPVCARCGPRQTLKTFVNSCLLGIHNCFNNQECTQISQGECRQTPAPILCPITYDPVCASCSFGPRTFQNKCFFSSFQKLYPLAHCAKVYDGKCRTSCPLYNCLLVKKPICALCGFEQRTFDNECIFNSYNCPSGFECTKISNGPCSTVQIQ